MNSQSKMKIITHALEIKGLKKNENHLKGTQEIHSDLKMEWSMDGEIIQVLS